MPVTWYARTKKRKLSQGAQLEDFLRERREVFPPAEASIRNSTGNNFAVCRTKFRHFARSYTTDAAEREERDGRSTQSDSDCRENERQATTE